MTFTPHNAVAVSFEWDGVSDKHYAILCQDYASESGYEYIETDRPQLGDGALIAEFSDGTITSPDWKLFVANHGPTDESLANGCGSNELDACETVDLGNPSDWTSPDFDYSDWETATVYTANEAGWGRAPTWEEGFGCCTATNPYTRETLNLNGGCSVNYDGASGREVMAEVSESECLSPREELGDSDAVFLWGPWLEYDNRILFRYSVVVEPSDLEEDAVMMHETPMMNITVNATTNLIDESMMDDKPIMNITTDIERTNDEEEAKEASSNEGALLASASTFPARYGAVASTVTLVLGILFYA